MKTKQFWSKCLLRIEFQKRVEVEKEEKTLITMTLIFYGMKSGDNYSTEPISDNDDI